LRLVQPASECKRYTQGFNEVTLAADALIVDRGFGPELFGVPEFALSRGLTSNSDVGGRIYPLGVEVFARRRLVRQPQAQLSVLPLLAFGQVSATNADTRFADVTSGAALLAGFELNPKLRLSVGLRSHLRLGLNAVAIREDFGAARWAVLIGSSASLDWRISSELVLNPGVILLLPYDIDLKKWDFPILQGGAGIKW
jgi:hypothetical protein